MNIACKLSWLLPVFMAPAYATAFDALSPLTATYVVERPRRDESRSQTFAWQLHRSASCVVANDSESRVSEQWSRDPEGRIWYKRIFHREKKVIEYQPADLRLGGVDAKWSRIASVIDPAELESMSLKAERQTFEGRSVSVYHGLRDGMQWEVAWLTGEQLPVQVRIQGERGHYSLRLQKLEAANASAAPMCSASDVQGFETIDFADIGDRHGDPFIEGLMKYEGFSHGH
jgi:hypothetical protein